MKKHTKNIIKIAFATVMVLVIGCEEYLEKQPLDGFSEESVYSDEALSTAYLMNVYNYIQRGFGARDDAGKQPEYIGNNGGEGNAYIWEVVTDNARNKSTWPLSQKIFIPGQMTPLNTVWSNWQGCYKGIRKANLLIEGLNSYEGVAPEVKTRIKAEARFVRAFLYFKLARRFGNVPLITYAQSFEEDLFTEQSTQIEIYNYVAAELDTLAPLLPAATDLPKTEYGRATTEAAWALQGRVYLFAAFYVKNEDMLTADTITANVAFCAKSAEASKKVIDSKYGYKLSPDYSAYFQSDGSEMDKESIFEIMGDPVIKIHAWDFYSSSAAFGGHSQYLPTQELVDEYETSNGLPITEDPAYNDQDPYANRDSRLASTIVYHGMEYRGVTTDHAQTRNVAGEIVAEGTDLQKKPFTSYWTKKFCYAGEPVATKISYQSWKELRLGEVLLNYAEAQNLAAGPDASVYAALDDVRERAKLPALSTVRPGLSQKDMITEIIHERRVELAFETHRYWDLVRYREAHTILKGFFHGINVYKDEATGDLTYERFEFNAKTKEQVFPMYYYLLPIPQSEMDKNPKLVQNPGY